MDYIYFINSRDIREYLYSLNYELTGEQKLFLIDNSCRVTFEEKIAALESLLDGPDEEVIIRNDLFMKNKDNKDSKKAVEKNEHRSLHDMVTRLIRYYRKLQDLFRQNDKNCFYEIFTCEDGFRKHSEACFHDLDCAMAYCRHNYSEDNSDDNYCDKHNFAIKITKRYMETSPDIDSFRAEKYITAAFSRDLQLYSLQEQAVISETEFSYKDSTDGLIIYLPMPFRRGDILTRSKDNLPYAMHNGSGTPDRMGDPFVVVDLSPDEKISRGWDSIDICCQCYYLNQSEGLNIKQDDLSHIYDLEYYRGEIKGRYRILKILSAILKGSKIVDNYALMHVVRYCGALADLEDAQHSLSMFPVVEYALTSKELQDQFRHNNLKTLSERYPDEIMGLTQSIRIWLDDEREAPEGYIHCHSVNETIRRIHECERQCVFIEELNLDHDLGDYAKDGGDAIGLLDFLVERETFYKVVLHTANPVGRANMQRTIDRYWH